MNGSEPYKFGHKRVHVSLWNHAGIFMKSYSMLAEFYSIFVFFLCGQDAQIEISVFLPVLLIYS